MKYWGIDSFDSIPHFLQAIIEFLPAVKTLSFEIHGECDEVREFYSKHMSSVKLRPSRDTIYPKTKLYYCSASFPLVSGLKALLQKRKNGDLFWHIKGYDDSKMLFALHDADSLCCAALSPIIDVKTIHSIATELNCKPETFESGFDWNQDFTPKKK